jgi:thiol-disulfide isomerase/thioredoxin
MVAAISSLFAAVWYPAGITLVALGRPVGRAEIFVLVTIRLKENSMSYSRRAVLSLALAASMAGTLAMAAEPTGFTPAAFEAAQKAGKPILVEVTAPWCPTCRAQAPIVKELSAEPKFKNLQVFAVDFDSQKDALQMFKAQRQSTLIVFKGAHEVGRSVGDTDKASIEALAAQGL